jgi:hypothetical protein
MTTVTKRIRATLTVVLILLAPAAMLYTLWGNPVSAGEDDAIYYYPMRKMVGEQLRKLQWPLENPHEATGTPMLADPQSAVMYPPTWLFAVMPAKPAYSLSLMLGFAIAGLGTYAYLRRLGLVNEAAGFGAVAMMFCGFLVGHRVHLSILHAAAWLPWGLWCIGMVPVAYLSLTAGHWPTFIHMSVIWAAYLLLRARPLARSLAVAGGAVAIVAMLAAPQIDATLRLMGQVTRNAVGYSTAGENSYYPASAALMLFPMLFGCRTQNFLAGPWWGPWHLCETLGYVGLVTLVLAAVGVWKLYRKQKKQKQKKKHSTQSTQRRIWSYLFFSATSALSAMKGFSGKTTNATLAAEADAENVDRFRSLVRVWTWIGAAALVWMLGYYLPTYRLVHMLPVLGVVRCPARMILALDMALVTIAAITVHLIIAGPGGWQARLAASVRRGATVKLPAAMATVLALTAAAGGLSVWLYGGNLPEFDGSAWTALRSVLPTNPAVWVQALLAAATIAVVRWWLAAPARRAAALVAVLLVDMFFVTRFVDVPAGGAVAPDPDESPAARWIADHDPNTRGFRVWGIGESYYDRPAELLRPKTAHALGISTINSYGPFQSAAHAQLFEFKIFGTNRNWAWLIRRNELLSAYGVRYILTARKDVREVLDSAAVPDGPPLPDGPNLLTGQWALSEARLEGGVLGLRKPLMSYWSTAQQPVKVRAGTIYRISLDARAPEGGAADYLRAELHTPDRDMPWPVKEPLGLMAYPDQIGQDWRHFEWTFKTPDDIDANTAFRVYTQSERAIEVRGVDFRESHWDRPRSYPSSIPPGQNLYLLRAELASRRHGDPPVAIYENIAFYERGFALDYWRDFALSPLGPWECALPERPMSSQEIEHVKWRYPPMEELLAWMDAWWPVLMKPEEEALWLRAPKVLPAVGVKVECRPTLMLFGTSAGGILYVIVLAAVGFAAAARRRE